MYKAPSRQGCQSSADKFLNVGTHIHITWPKKYLAWWQPQIINMCFLIDWLIFSNNRFKMVFACPCACSKLTNNFNHCINDLKLFKNKEQTSAGFKFTATPVFFIARISWAMSPRTVLKSLIFSPSYYLTISYESKTSKLSWLQSL